MKKIKTILISLVLILLMYAISWCAFYYFTVKPHISDNSNVVLKERYFAETYFDMYVPDENVEYPNKPYDSYVMYVPHFLCWQFYFGFASAQNYEPETGLINNPSGSKYDYNMLAFSNVFGKVERYKFTLVPIEKIGTMDEVYIIHINPDGSLIEKSDTTAATRKVYQDAKDEILSVIDTANNLFGF